MEEDEKRAKGQRKIMVTELGSDVCDSEIYKIAVDVFIFILIIHKLRRFCGKGKIKGQVK